MKYKNFIHFFLYLTKMDSFAVKTIDKVFWWTLINLTFWLSAYKEYISNLLESKVYRNSLYSIRLSSYFSSFEICLHNLIHKFSGTTSRHLGDNFLWISWREVFALAMCGSFLSETFTPMTLLSKLYHILGIQDFFLLHLQLHNNLTLTAI